MDVQLAALGQGLWVVCVHSPHMSLQSGRAAKFVSYLQTIRDVANEIVTFSAQVLPLPVLAKAPTSTVHAF